MVVNGAEVKMAEINFLCVRKDVRTKKLAPMLIKEITRRVNLQDIWQAIYTTGITIPTPFAQPQYWHRNLNPQKLVDVGFSYCPSGTTNAQFTRMHRLPKETTLNLRPMKESDAGKVCDLINDHMRQMYKVHITFDEEEIKHFFLPKEDVVYSYLVEADKGEITDFTSFYVLKSSILGDLKYNVLNSCYNFYTVAQGHNNAERFKTLVKDALILCKHTFNYDVYNMTEVMQNSLVTDQLLFKPGDGILSHYIYNWRQRSIEANQVGITLV